MKETKEEVTAPFVVVRRDLLGPLYLRADGTWTTDTHNVLLVRSKNRAEFLAFRLRSQFPEFIGLGVKQYEGGGVHP